MSNRLVREPFRIPCPENLARRGITGSLPEVRIEVTAQTGDVPARYVSEKRMLYPVALDTAGEH
jgi:hypothetical protein